jgi:hypothetical protein
VEIHYAIGGAGEPVFLLHGVPKTMSYWRHVVPLLTPHYTVIADVAELEPFYCPELSLIAKHNLVSHQPYYRRAYQYAWQKGNG